jgi:tRNA A37 threonylcarbamoyladenosine dehydratase
LPETAEQVDFAHYDYVVDAIDTVTGKIELAVCAKEHGIRIISSMGAGNKVDAAALTVADVYSTSVCPLAKVMRRELRKRGVEALKVVYSKEEPLRVTREPSPCHQPVPGSTAFVPAVAGLIMAGEVVKDLVGEGRQCKVVYECKDMSEQAAQHRQQVPAEYSMDSCQREEG